MNNDIVVPDLAAWRADRLPPEARKEAAFSVAPDWVCEVASPSTAQRDRALKSWVYAASGVSFMWLVEPVDGRVEAFERADKRWMWLGTWTDERAACIPPFDAVGVDLVRLWESTGLRG
jgi:Uma2 family endonuclease